MNRHFRGLNAISTANKFVYLTVEEYLRSEEMSPVRHEYVDGRIFAMAGANRRHNVIAGNFFARLHAFLAGGPCRPYMEAFKVRVAAAECFYYPDVMVACDEGDDSVYTDAPRLIIEVLSPATAAVDRREKLTNYMKIPTLWEYLIVHQRRKKVELYRRGDDETWMLHEYSSGEVFVLESLPEGTLEIAVDYIYSNVSTNSGSLEVKEAQDEYVLSGEELLALDW
jgi:Uma2 family endonuclease